MGNYGGWRLVVGVQTGGRGCPIRSANHGSHPALDLLVTSALWVSGGAPPLWRDRRAMMPDSNDGAPAPSSTARAIRFARWAASSGLLLWLAASHWPECVDDVYILADYGRQWANHGTLAWTDGSRVEGFSSPALVGLAALATLGDMAPELALKLTALGASIMTLAFLSWTVPLDALGTVAILALAGSTPFVHWAVDGMDTPLFGLALALGWHAVSRGHPVRAGFALGFASLVRPEGAIHALLGGLLGWRAQGGLQWALGAALAAAGAGAQVAWFGPTLPTPLVVKVLGTELGVDGLVQAAGESLPLLGALLTVVPGLSRSKAVVVLMPVVIQCAVLAAARGDWMGHGRLLLPGVISCIACAERASPQRASWAWGSALLGLLGAVVDPVGEGTVRFHLQQPEGLARTRANYGRGLVTPLPEDVAWVIEHVPDGGRVLINDVGFIGGIPGVRVIDLRGLVTREVANEIRAGTLDTWLRALFADPIRRPFAVRLAWWGSDPTDPAWIEPPYPARTELRYPGGRVVWYAESGTVDPRTSAGRWLALSTQHPDHAWVLWRASIAAAGAGDVAGAEALFQTGRQRFPRDSRFLSEAGGYSFSAGTLPLDWVPGRGFAMYWNGTLETTPQPCDVSLELEVDPEAAGLEPVRIEVSWGQSTTMLEAEVRHRFPLAGLCAAGSEAPVRVTFVNDFAEGGHDRNVYIRLLTTGGPGL